MSVFKYRFTTEYYNHKVREVNNAPLMNPGIKREILRRMANAKRNLDRGYIIVDEFMRLLSMECCDWGEDMGEYADDGWEPFTGIA